MRILVTNDDGMEAPGLGVLVAELAAAGFDLSVAAPFDDRSGSGSGLGSIDDGAEVRYASGTFPGVPGVAAHRIDAPPSFAVLAAAAGLFGERPDIVVSGINDGYNTGRMLIGSSTVGAVLTGAALGLRGLAVSAGFAPQHRFDTAAAVAVGALRWLSAGAPPRTVLNLNVPDLDLAELRGVRPASLAPRSLMGLRLEREDDVIRLRRYENTVKLGEATDSAWVAAGYAALSVLSPITAAEDPGGSGTDPAAAVEAALRLRATADAVTG